MKIDYELINTFPQLGLYQSKSAIAGYAEENFGLKIPRNLSYENMLKKLEDHVATSVPAPNSKTFKLEEPTVDVELNDAIDSLAEDVDTVITDVESQYVPTVKIQEMAKEVAKTNDKKTDLMNLLPPDFKPCFVPMDDVESFYPLSYWINDWIQETPDWYYKVNEYPRVQEHKFLYTLVHFIAKFGKFTIRETRNGAYVTLS